MTQVWVALEAEYESDDVVAVGKSPVTLVEWIKRERRRREDGTWHLAVDSLAWRLSCSYSSRSVADSWTISKWEVIE